MNPTPSFDEAIQLATDLIKCQENDGSGDILASIRELLTATASARGFFVALLTLDWQFGDEIPASIIETCTKAGAIADELLAKNLIMSSCTRVQHIRSGNLEHAAGSERVIRRTKYILVHQSEASDSLTAELISMKEAIGQALTGNVSEQLTNKYTAFLIKWKYDSQQLESAGENLDDVLMKLAQQPQSR